MDMDMDMDMDDGTWTWTWISSLQLDSHLTHSCAQVNSLQLDPSEHAHHARRGGPAGGAVVLSMPKPRPCSSGRARANYHLHLPVGQKRCSVAELQHWFLRASGASRLVDLPAITYDEDPARWSTVTTTLCEMQSVPGSTAQYLHHHQNQ